MADSRQELLRRAGEFLFGNHWQRPIARALGPCHPAGARDAIDHRLVRRWADGERPVPDWVGAALIVICRERDVAIEQIVESLMKW